MHRYWSVEFAAGRSARSMMRRRRLANWPTRPVRHRRPADGDMLSHHRGKRVIVEAVTFIAFSSRHGVLRRNSAARCRKSYHSKIDGDQAKHYRRGQKDEKRYRSRIESSNRMSLSVKNGLDMMSGFVSGHCNGVLEIPTHTASRPRKPQSAFDGSVSE